MCMQESVWGTADGQEKVPTVQPAVESIDFVKWEAALKKNNPGVNLIVFACFPPCKLIPNPT